MFFGGVIAVGEGGDSLQRSRTPRLGGSSSLRNSPLSLPSEDEAHTSSAGRSRHPAAVRESLAASLPHSKQS